MKPRYAHSRRISKDAVGITFIPHLSQADINKIIDQHWEMLNKHEWDICIHLVTQDIKSFKDKQVAEFFAVIKIVLIDSLTFRK